MIVKGAEQQFRHVDDSRAGSAGQAAIKLIEAMRLNSLE